ncbi:hypothetical protein [Marinitoga sp. 1155]|uniref:glycoside hydrolase family 130 protein n=1 Tax=Marinitoga sp. 1155 TaxID=1428448 RepID=UPI0006582BFA|nr:hypothetical protein [Marinitoga sp. 1155]KLO24631.1 glycosidase [Marinitoga sp. 1155]
MNQLYLSKFTNLIPNYKDIHLLPKIIKKMFFDERLRKKFDIILKDGVLIDQHAELGKDVVIESGAAVLGNSKILKGKIKKGAIVIDSIIGKIDANPNSLFYLVEQLNDKEVSAKKDEMILDLIILKNEIIKKVRLVLKKWEDLNSKKFIIDGEEMLFDAIISLSKFKRDYINGTSYDFRKVLFNIPVKDLFEKNSILKRYEKNPILSPIPKNNWESKLVYNPAALRIDGIHYIVYRAFGNDHISRFGLAWSKNGLDIDGRLDFPIFIPTTEYEIPKNEKLNERKRERGGVEDPRLTIINKKIYMTYTAYSDKTQIALASIDIKDFINLKDISKNEIKNKWTKHGLLFPNIYDRNAVLFPEKINGKHALLRRPMISKTKNIAISYSNKIEEIWNNDFVDVLKTRKNKWDSERIGAGQILRTVHGLLLIYHGVGINKGRRSYMLGVALLNPNNPSEILYRSKKPIFLPEEDYELYGWAPNVVFTNGITMKNKDSNEIIKDKDELLFYYGGGDKVIGVASAKLMDILSS